MSITLRREGGEPTALSVYQVLRLLPAHNIDAVPVLRRLGLGETVPVQLADETWATLTLNTFPGQSGLGLPAHEPTFNARCTLLIPLRADVRCRAPDVAAARDQIHAVLRGERAPPRHFQVIINTAELDDIWYGIDHDSGTLKVPFRHIEIESIDQVHLLRGPVNGGPTGSPSNKFDGGPI